MIRCVSIARRRMRRPASRSCSQIGVSQSAGPPLSTSPPQMSLTSTSRRPWSRSMRAGEGLHLGRVEVVDGDRDAGAAELGDERRRLLDRLGPVVVGAQGPGRAGAAGADDGGAGLAERGGDAASRRHASRRRRPPPARAAPWDPAPRSSAESAIGRTVRDGPNADVRVVPTGPQHRASAAARSSSTRAVIPATSTGARPATCTGMESRPVVAVREQLMDVPPRFDAAAGLGLVGTPEALGDLGGVQHGQVEPAVTDVEVRWRDPRPGPVDDGAEAPTRPEDVEVLVVAVHEPGDARRWRRRDHSPRGRPHVRPQGRPGHGEPHRDREAGCVRDVGRLRVERRQQRGELAGPGVDVRRGQPDVPGARVMSSAGVPSVSAPSGDTPSSRGAGTGPASTAASAAASFRTIGAARELRRDR